MARKKEMRYHCCRDCQYAHLIKYTGDPLLADCKFGGERQVASTLLPCGLFKPRVGDAEIEHRKKRIGITNNFY